MTPPQGTPSPVPFTLACVSCDADSPETFEEAVQQGWTDIQPDDGLGWNYLGICPACRPAWESAPPTQP
jgi:hypothetical protein